MLKYECSSPSVTVNIGISSVTLKSASWSWVILPNSRSELIIIHRFLLPVAYPRLISLICFLFCFTNSMMENMREIEKCKAHVQDVEVPLEVFEWVHCCWFPCKLIITTGHYNRDQAIIKSQVCHEHYTIFIRSITKECIETFSLRFEVAKCNITVKKIVLNRISWSAQALVKISAQKRGAYWKEDA